MKEPLSARRVWRRGAFGGVDGLATVLLIRSFNPILLRCLVAPTLYPCEAVLFNLCPT